MDTDQPFQEQPTLPLEAMFGRIAHRASEYAFGHVCGQLWAYLLDDNGTYQRFERVCGTNQAGAAPTEVRVELDAWVKDHPQYDPERLAYQLLPRQPMVNPWGRPTGSLGAL